MGHHTCCNKQKVKRGLWSPEEDKKLVEYIANNGHGNWSSVPRLAGLQRCGKSCRLRWVNYLRPDLKHGSFSPQEEAIIIELQSIVGNSWSRIAKHLPGRTDNEVKNFWNTNIKKKLIGNKKPNLILNSQEHQLDQIDSVPALVHSPLLIPPLSYSSSYGTPSLCYDQPYQLECSDQQVQHFIQEPGLHDSVLISPSTAGSAHGCPLLPKMLELYEIMNGHVSSMLPCVPPSPEIHLPARLSCSTFGIHPRYSQVPATQMDHSGTIINSSLLTVSSLPPL